MQQQYEHKQAALARAQNTPDVENIAGNARRCHPKIMPSQPPEFIPVTGSNRSEVSISGKIFSPLGRLPRSRFGKTPTLSYEPIEILQGI